MGWKSGDFDPGGLWPVCPGWKSGDFDPGGVSRHRGRCSGGGFRCGGSP